ncbi:MAG: hypothetical protein KME43_12100 [Myxacorys chilensis ATA2-1-KO14]|nr:hypothetical protein [Myxacorys chilensis ATA2-1-KO14]
MSFHVEVLCFGLLIVWVCVDQPLLHRLLKVDPLHNRTPFHLVEEYPGETIGEHYTGLTQRFLVGIKASQEGYTTA